MCIYNVHCICVYTMFTMIRVFMKENFLCLQNLLDNFNPGLRQLVSSGRAYQKSLQGRH